MKRIRQLWRRLTSAATTRMRPVETVSEARLSEMFKHAPDSPSWKATLAVLDQQTVDALDRCVDERLTDQQMRYRLGGVAALLEFKQELEDRELEARKMEQEQTERTENRKG